MNSRSPSIGFVDVHSHILPGVDDGPQTMEAAMGILRSAAASGTSVMVATPHGGQKARWTGVEHLKKLCRGLNEFVERERLPIEIVLGMENDFDISLPEQFEKGRALTINNSSYILVELPFNTLPIYWEDVLFKLQLKGLRPIIAHAERQQQLQEKPELLIGPVSRGVLVQITAGSLVGYFGGKAKKAAQTLLKRELAHVVASDAHKPEGQRGPDLLEGFHELKRLIGEDKALRLMAGVGKSFLNMGGPNKA
jgi:protein-tyrosine phosphatase